MGLVIFDLKDADNVVADHYSAGQGQVLRSAAMELTKISFESGKGAEMHQHPEEQVLYVIEGLFDVTLGEKTYEVGPGQASYHPSNVPRRAVAREAATAPVLQVPRRSQLRQNGRSGVVALGQRVGVTVPFIHYDQIERECVTPKHSTAYGALAAGQPIEVGLLSFKGGEGANPHRHPHEQIVVVLKGRIRARVGDAMEEFGPGSGPGATRRAPRHDRTRGLQGPQLQDLIDGKGHRI